MGGLVMKAETDASLQAKQHLPSLSEEESSESSSEGGSDFAGIDVSALFAGVKLPDTEPVAAAGTSASSVSEAKSQKQARDLSHSNMVRQALEVSGVRTTDRSKRSRGKRAFDARTLQHLATDPSLVTRADPLSRADHRAGFHEFRRWYITLSGESWRAGDSQAAKRWTEYTNNERYHWVVVRKACRACGHSQLKQAPPKMLRQFSVSISTKGQGAEEGGGEGAAAGFFLAVGLLLTFFPRIGLDDPDVGVWVRQGFRGAELREKLLTKMAYRAYFDAFVAFLQKFRDEYGFSSLCACMELGEETRSVARVHLHAYVGFLQKDGGIGSMRTLKVPRTALVWSGCTPFVVATRGQRNRRMHETVARGMYYVVGPKATCMLRYTDLEPIKDSKTQ